MQACHLIINNNSNFSYVNLPCYPDEISDSISANWYTENIVGRSVPIDAYTGTNHRTGQFTLPMHREMANENTIETVVQALRSSVFPEYQSRGLIPPIATFVFGDFVIKGIVRSVSFQWKRPIINRKYSNLDATISIEETAGQARSASELGTSMNPFKY